MRPHLLRVTAFGAFGGTAEVSFDDLAGSGLFLLHGETGAGKTTLLDAIGFALYGRVPGERNKTKRLRSDHAGAAVRTEVMFETTIGDRRLRITRRPQQDRPKVHGTGLTSEPAKILLEEERGGRWHTVSTRAREADDEIADAMGMSAEQFFQVVLLPQGEFAKFLHADADERRALLQKLFRTDRFRTVEAWLAERRKATRDQVEKADQALATLAARIAQVAGAPLPGVSPASSGLSGAALPAPRRRPRTARGLGRCPRSRGGIRAAPRRPRPPPAAQQALDAARAAEADTQVLAGRQGRRAALLARGDELRAGAPERDALRLETDAARRAAEIAKVFDDAEQAGAHLAHSRDAEAGARAAAAPAGLPDTAGAADFRAAEQQRREHIGQLMALREVAGQADAEDANAAAAAERAAARARDIDAARQALADQQARLEDLTGRRDAAQRAATRLPAVQADAERQRAAASDAAQLAEACAGQRDLHSERETAREIANDLAERALLIRRDRIDGMVAELAASLVDGTPCPVCGSQDHPDKPEIQPRRVTHQEEEQAVAEADAGRETVAKLNSELAGLAALAGDFAGRLAAAGVTDPVLGEAGGRAPGAATIARLHNLAAGLAAAAARSKRRPVRSPPKPSSSAATTLTWASCGRRSRRPEKRLSALAEQRQAALAEAAAAQDRAAGHRASLLRQLGGAPDLEAALAAAAALAGALAAAASADRGGSGGGRGRGPGRSRSRPGGGRGGVRGRADGARGPAVPAVARRTGTGHPGLRGRNRIRHRAARRSGAGRAAGSGRRPGRRAGGGQAGRRAARRGGHRAGPGPGPGRHPGRAGAPVRGRTGRAGAAARAGRGGPPAG